MPPFGLIILILIIAFPLLEIVLLIKIGSALGIWLTLAIVIGTTILGMMVFRLQGQGVSKRAFEGLQNGQPPVAPMIETALLGFAAVCLIAPGFITDAIGLLLLVAPLRQALAAFISARTQLRGVGVRVRRARGFKHPARSDAGATIDGDFERLAEHDLPSSGHPIDKPTPKAPSRDVDDR